MQTPDVQTLVGLGALIGGLYGAWRSFVKPQVWQPCVHLHARISTALDTVDQLRIMLPNGGTSLGDTITATHALALSTNGMATITRARIDVVWDQFDVPIFEAGPDGLNVRINACFERVFGYRPADMIGRRWIRILHVDDRPGYLEEWTQAVADGRFFDRTARYLTRSGAICHVRVTAEPRSDDGSTKVLWWVGKINLIHVEPASEAQA